MITKSKKNTISVIGKSGHATRIINILKSKEAVELYKVYYHKPIEQQSDELPLTNDFNEILVSDAIVIASPTPTHAQYLDLLENYDGYVLVEKPIVSTVAETQKLERISQKRRSKIKVNYNLSYSSLFSILLDAIKMPEVGVVISLNVHTSHGLAFNDKYKSSWRNTQAFGVMELVGVHYINCAIKLFGGVVDTGADVYWYASNSTGKVPDTIFIRLNMVSNVQVNLFHSYAAPFYNRVMLFGTNGYIECDGKSARLFSPRETFDENGRFTAPPLIKEQELDFAHMWKDSLANAIDDFVSKVHSKEGFDSQDFHIALETMRPIFNAQESLKDAHYRGDSL